MQLPAPLREKIEALIGADNKKILSGAALDVSLKYRRETASPDLQIDSDSEARAYVATRLPATWCSVTDVLHRLLESWPGFSPSTLLDLGAGPGTASLAAENIWPGLACTLVEPNPHLRTVGRHLVETADWVDARLENFGFEKSYDLVIASYVFNEINSDMDAILKRAWEKTDGALVLIEPGTPHGYAEILKARDSFLGSMENGAKEANIAAPCPHSYRCPLAGSERWCHFSVRVDRSRLHRQIKDARLSYEDEKFSYLVLTRQNMTRPVFRALGQPRGQKLVEVETCNDDGSFAVRRFSKKSPEYRPVRKISWGDAYDG